MLFVIVRMISLLVAFTVAPLSVLLFLFGHSFESTLFSLAGILIGVLPLGVCIIKEQGARGGGWIAIVGLIGFAVLGFWLSFLSPTGRLSERAKIQHRFVDGQPGFHRYALGNLLPELDQFLLGFKVVPLMDRLFTFKQSRHLAALTEEIYQELEVDPDFHELGSVMPLAYEELCLGGAQKGHYYLYIPASLDRTKPAPTLVFLHGSGGNFKAYSWLLSKIADDLGMILICPSFGVGNWTEEASAEVVRDALRDAEKVTRLDRQRMHLMGLSNGGRGVGHVGRDMGEQFKSITLISPVVELPGIRSSSFIQNWKGKPIFIITGKADDRVPLESVNYVASIMKEYGAEVTLKSIPEADHFLLFSHREEVVEQMKGWLRSVADQPVSLTAAPGSPTHDNTEN